LIGKDKQAPTADLAPRAKRSRSPDVKGGQKDGQAKDGQTKDGAGADGQKKDGQGKNGEHRGKREHGEGDQKAPASGNEQSGGAAKSQP
jgi:multidrug efflux system membrane fusion protein